MALRKPTDDELRFISFMIREGNGTIDPQWPETLMVAPMDDGGMGSLNLYPEGKVMENREFGRTLYEFEFKDVDRIAVIASLNLDQHGGLFELDFWKLTFDPLIKIPEL